MPITMWILAVPNNTFRSQPTANIPQQYSSIVRVANLVSSKGGGAVMQEWGAGVAGIPLVENEKERAIVQVHLIEI